MERRSDILDETPFGFQVATVAKKPPEERTSLELEDALCATQLAVRALLASRRPNDRKAVGTIGRAFEKRDRMALPDELAYGTIYSGKVLPWLAAAPLPAVQAFCEWNVRRYFDFTETIDALDTSTAALKGLGKLQRYHFITPEGNEAAVSFLHGLQLGIIDSFLPYRSPRRISRRIPRCSCGVEADLQTVRRSRSSKRLNKPPEEKLLQDWINEACLRETLGQAAASLGGGFERLLPDDEAPLILLDRPWREHLAHVALYGSRRVMNPLRHGPRLYNSGMWRQQRQMLNFAMWREKEWIQGKHLVQAFWQPLESVQPHRHSVDRQFRRSFQWLPELQGENILRVASIIFSSLPVGKRMDFLRQQTIRILGNNIRPSISPEDMRRLMGYYDVLPPGMRKA